jgi:dCMP deaminase
MRTYVEKVLAYLPLVQAVGAMSLDPSTKVGCIAFDDNLNILATGRNGFPRGVEDKPERYENREVKYKLISHSEQNLVAQAAYGGRSLKGSTVLLSALFPCSSCAKSLIQAGVIRVISPPPDTSPRWAEEAFWATLLLKEAGVEVIHYKSEAPILNTPALPDVALFDYDPRN